MLRAIVPTVLAALVVAGCGGYVGRAHRAYDDGRYLEAAERLGQREDELGELSPRRQAEYGVVRGMALLQLGDLGGAHRWLSFAYEVERQSPGALRPEHRIELDAGWAKLGQALAAAPGAVVVRAPPPGPGGGDPPRALVPDAAPSPSP